MEKPSQREARGHLVLRRPVRVGAGGHRVDEAKFVRQLREVRQQIADHLPRLPTRPKTPQRRRQVALLALKSNEPIGARHYLSIASHQFRLVVKGIDVADRARAEDIRTRFAFASKCGGRGASGASGRTLGRMGSASSP